MAAAVERRELRVGPTSTISACRRAPGTFVDRGAARPRSRALDPVREGRWHDVTERIVVDSQLEAPRPTATVLVTARIVGGTLDADAVDRVWVRDGVDPDAGRRAAPCWRRSSPTSTTCPAPGPSRLAGDQDGHVLRCRRRPGGVLRAGPEGTVLAEADLATVYCHLADAQALIGRPGIVNDVVLTVAPGGDIGRVERTSDRSGRASPASGLDVTEVGAVDAHRVLYEDIDNDQQFFTAFAVLVLVAAALAAFNLVNRIVEAQRREIGIGMALGAPRRQLSVRPLLVGVQIAVIGVIAGVVVGWIVARAMQGLLESMLPLPEYRTPFQVAAFAQAAALGVAIPILASAWPVWRAVHVEPIEAIRTGHLTARGGRSTELSRRVRLPGSSIGVDPVAEPDPHATTDRPHRHWRRRRDRSRW